MNKGVLDLLKQRYLWEWNINGEKKQETVEDMFLRVSKKVASAMLKLPHGDTVTVKDMQKKATEFYNMMIKGDFIPSSPQLFNVMRGYDPTFSNPKMYNLIYKPIDKMTYKDFVLMAEFENPKAAYGSCYSMGRIEDSIEGIYSALWEQAEVFRAAGGYGVSFSNLREKGSEVRSTQGNSCGPLGFMQLFNENTKLIALTGKTRRGMVI